MNTNTIILPSHNKFTSWLDTAKDFNQLFLISNTIIIDFINVNFIEPKHVVILSCFLEYYYRDNKKIEFTNVRTYVNTYLNNIHFYNYFDINQKRIGYTIPRTSTTIPLWNIDKAESYSYSLFAQDFIERNFYSNKDLLFIQTNFSEIFNNIFDHSNCLINGYVLTQVYPNADKIKFCVCDLGDGIPTTINNMLRKMDNPILEDFKAIELSTELKVTAKSKPHNAGLGLHQIISLCYNNLGNVEIYSNRGYLNSDTNIFNCNHNISFQGTLINITIDTTKVENQDIEELELLNF